MTRKRKACEALDELWGQEESGHDPPPGTLLQEEEFIPTLPANQAYDSQTVDEASGASKDTFQQPVGEASAMAYTCDPITGVVASEGHESNSRSGRNVSTAKRKRISEAARLKKITINCEWNLCTMEFNKMERFISHITEHLQAITGLHWGCHSFSV